MQTYSQTVSKELKSMLASDQDDLLNYREKKLSRDEILVHTVERSDRFRQILENHFPSITHVGRDGYIAGVTIVLHSGDVDLMQTYLKKHQEQMADNVDMSHRAFITDKILIALGKEQKYGTQFRGIVDGKVDFFPLESLELVDERRKELLLPTMAEYEQAILKSIY